MRVPKAHFCVSRCSFCRRVPPLSKVRLFSSVSLPFLDILPAPVIGFEDVDALAVHERVRVPKAHFFVSRYSFCRKVPPLSKVRSNVSLPFLDSLPTSVPGFEDVDALAFHERVRAPKAHFCVSWCSFCRRVPPLPKVRLCSSLSLPFLHSCQRR